MTAPATKRPTSRIRRAEDLSSMQILKRVHGIQQYALGTWDRAIVGLLDTLADDIAYGIHRANGPITLQTHDRMVMKALAGPRMNLMTSPDFWTYVVK